MKKSEPATSKQIDYLASLGKPRCDSKDLTKRQAQMEIQRLLEAQKATSMTSAKLSRWECN